MKLIDCKWNAHLNKPQTTYLANTLAEVKLDKVDANSAEGSIIIVISENVSYMKNTVGKWQKIGGTEVI